MVSESQPPVDDLFGDDDLKLGDADPPPSDATRRFPFAIILTIGIMVGLGLFWYASSVQNDRYFLIVEGDMVHVERGYFFPFGSGEWSESRAYVPFQLAAGIKVAKSGAMSAKELDAELLRIYVAIANAEVTDLKSGRPDVAEDMLWRAQKLRSTSVTDERRLLRLLGDVAFRRGLTEVRGIQSRFDQALEQFTLSAMRGGQSYRGASKWVEEIKRLRQEFRRLAVDSGLDPDLILTDAPTPPPPSPSTAPAASPSEPEGKPSEPADSGEQVEVK